MRTITRIFFTVLTVGLLLSLATGCSKKAKTSRHLQRADKYFDAGQYPKAEIEYLNTLRFDGTNSRAIGRLGAIYYEQGRFVRAFVFLSKARELSPDDLDLRIKLATLYLSAHKTKEAREEINFVLDNNPAQPEAPVLLAEAATTRTNLDLARLRLEKLSAQIGETAPLVLSMGVLQLREGNAKAAEETIKRAQAIDPKSSAIHYALGTLCWAQNDLKGADAALKLAAALSPERSTRRLSYADFKIKTGDLDEGKRLLTLISKEAPDYLPAWIRQAEIALAERQFANCASLLNQALTRDPDNYDAMILHGRLLLAQGEPAKAAEELDRTTKLYDYSPQAQYFLGLAHLLNKDVAKALKSFNRSVILDPNYPEAVLALAELNIRKGNAALAIAPLTKLSQQRPQIYQAHLLLASADVAQKNLDDAVAVYTGMRNSFPKSPQVPLLLGIVLAEQNKPAEARKAFEIALELAPDYLLAVEELVGLDLAGRQFDAALARANQQIDKNSTNATPNLLLAKVHMARAQDFANQLTEKLPAASRTNVALSAVPAAQPDVAKAEAALLKAVELDPNLQPAHLLLSQFYVTANKHQEALARLTALVAKTNNISALMQIGMIQNGLKNFTAARDAYERLLTLDPNFTAALNNLAFLYSEPLNQLDKAFPLAEKARRLQPNDPFSADTLGWILYKRGEYSRALGLIEESVEKLTADPEIQYHLGMAHYMLGEEEPARVALEKAALAPKDFQGKEEAARRIAILAIDVKTADAAAAAGLEKRLVEDPNDPVAAARLAAIYERDGAIAKAATTYEKVHKLNPQNVRAMAKLADLYQGPLTNTEKAFELAKEAHGLAPDDAQISLTLGRLVYQQRDYKWSLSLLEEAVRKLPDQPEALYDLAWANYQMGQVNRAESAMQQAVLSGAAFTKLDDARRFLALVAASRDLEQARKGADQAQQVLKTEPNYLPAIMVSALLLEESNRAGAQQLYNEVMVANSLFTPAIRKLALLLARDRAQDQKTYDLLVKARQAYPDDAEVAMTLGLLAYDRKEDSRAAQLLAQSAQTRQDDPELRYYLGMAHYRLKHRTEAKASLEQALAMNVSTKLATEAKRVLAELNK